MCVYDKILTSRRLRRQHRPCIRHQCALFTYVESVILKIQYLMLHSNSTLQITCKEIISFIAIHYVHSCLNIKKVINLIQKIIIFLNKYIHKYSALKH